MGKSKREEEAAAPATAAPPSAAPAEPAAPRKSKKAKADAAAQGGAREKRGRSMRGRSKRYRSSSGKVEAKKRYPLEQAVKLLRTIAAGTKFTQTVNVVMHLGIDPKIAEQMIRGSVSLPRGIGKKKRVIAFCEGDDEARAKSAGAIEAGGDDLIKRVNDGWLDFDVAIAHPRVMGKVGKLGRVLGPQGKMPTPKNGTVTADIETAIREFAAGKIEFRNDTGGNIHAIVGRADFSEDDLRENISAFVEHIRRMKPPTSKGTYIKKACISGTMTPAIELEVTQA